MVQSKKGNVIKSYLIYEKNKIHIIAGLKHCTALLFPVFNYRTRISRGLYTFTPFFTEVYNQERAVNITDNLCTKQGNYSIKSAASWIFEELKIVLTYCEKKFVGHA